MSTDHFAPAELFQCPTCASPAGLVGQQAMAGLDMRRLVCNSCKTQHFRLGGVPCLFPGGEHHKAIWQHQAGVMQRQGQQGLAQLRATLSRYDLTPHSRARLIDTCAALELSQSSLLALLVAAGLQPKVDEGLGSLDPGDLAEYFDLILRDWAWQSDENKAALTLLLQALPATYKPQRILVLGAGAGRLSWDLHCALAPALTLALDSNPLLLVAAYALIRQRQTVALAEFKMFPQIDRDATRDWLLQPPEDVLRRRDSWFALGANAWRAPLQTASFDLVITPWFIDVNGGDVRDTIALVSRLLTPGGRWVNSGPLLFTRHLPLEQKYSASEIKEFLTMSGFAMESEQVTESDHLDSPLEARKQHEQLWTFCARAPIADVAAPPVFAQCPNWLIMHHLPIPQNTYLSPEQHPLIDAVLALVDGRRSINDIAAQIAPYLPAGISAKDAVVTLFGEITATAPS